jgi:hypothetical protein
MKNFDENELIDKAMAGRLNTEEQRLWAALVAKRPELETEVEIGRALRSVPKPPKVSTNFTALVLQQVDRFEQSAASSWAKWLRWPKVIRLPFWAGAAMVVLGLGVTINHNRKQELVAKSVESLAGGLSVVSVVEPDVQPHIAVVLARDFEANRNLPASDNVDYELLTALGE